MDSLDPILTSLIIVFYAILGLCLGSFSSAIAHRTAEGESWIVDKRKGDVQPARSNCPSCGHTLSFFDLIPLFSWIFLKGECRYCHTKIPVRYPLLELTGAIAMVFFALSVASKLATVIFVITLPFSLVFVLLLSQQLKPPIYIYGLFFSNIFVWVSAVLYEKGA